MIRAGDIVWSAKRTRRLPWRARNDANHYELVDGSLDVVRDIADFYGLSRVPEPLVAEFNIKGRLTQLNLINDPLRRLLLCRSLPTRAPPAPASGRALVGLRRRRLLCPPLPDAAAAARTQG